MGAYQRRETCRLSAVKRAQHKGNSGFKKNKRENGPHTGEFHLFQIRAPGPFRVISLFP